MLTAPPPEATRAPTPQHLPACSEPQSRSSRTSVPPPGPKIRQLDKPSRICPECRVRLQATGESRYDDMLPRYLDVRSSDPVILTPPHGVCSNSPAESRISSPCIRLALYCVTLDLTSKM